MKKQVKITLVMSILFLLSTALVWSQGSSITGTWKTIDDEDNTPKSEVKIWIENGKYFGKIVKIFDPENQNSRCTECDDDDPRYNKKVLGMTIITDLEKTENNLWEDGEILDPNNGSVYSCKMWLTDDETLMLRGFIGFSMIGRTQKWIRVN